EIAAFRAKGGIFFSDEVLFGSALSKVLNTTLPVEENISLLPVDISKIRGIINKTSDGYLAPNEVQQLLDAVGIGRVREKVVDSQAQALETAKEMGFPLVMKVVGPVHKSDVGGVTLHVNDLTTVQNEFTRMMQIRDTTSVLMQSQLTGTQLFVGAKREELFGHTIVCGFGGIFVEVFKDISYGLSPLSQQEAINMIRSLQCYPMIKGIRGQKGVNEEMFVQTIQRVSALCQAAPEIAEMDINPLLGTSKHVTAVDARIRIEKKIN
ncbi:MAG: acetate--CoA ligase family protein, partial [Prevotellaceae bacterium]|nr:acetate--CoA ligase family protein [Prevotellaceae bacterium]